MKRSDRLKALIKCLKQVGLTTSALLIMFTLPVAAQTKLTVGYDGAKLEEEWFKTVFEAYTKIRPDISLELIPVAGNYQEKIRVLYAAGSAPDIFWGTDDKQGFIHEGMVLDIAPYIAKDKNLQLNDFLPWSINAWKKGLVQYGLPITIDYKGMIYNKDLLDESGLAYPPSDWDTPNWTWDTMLAYGRKLTKVNSDGLAEQFGLWIQNKGHWGVDIPWIFGGDWVSPDSYKTGVVETVTINQPANITAYTALQDMLWKTPVMPGGALAWSTKVSSPFPAGKSAMEWRASWKLKSYTGKTMPFPWGVAPYPIVKTRKNTLFVDPLFVNSTTKYPQEAYDFISFATNSVNLATMAEIIATPPARRSSMRAYVEKISQLSGLSSQAVMNDFVDSMNYAQPNADAVLYFADITTAIDKALVPMWQGKTGALEALEQAQKGVAAHIKELKSR